MYSKENFMAVARTINREGINDLLNYLENETDFFTSPASTQYHNNFEGGLCDHSMNVYDMLSKNNVLTKDFSDDTIKIVSLFHDICKVNTIITSTRNVKNEKTGQWEKQPFYKTENKFPFGHGEKSVYMLMKYIKLSDKEAMAINWHMGAFDLRADGYDLTGAFGMNQLAVELHIADLRAAYITENN